MVDKLNAYTNELFVVQVVKLERDQKRLDYYISLLDERQINVLQLLYVKKLPQGEAEKMMGLSAKTVRKLKNEALNALAEMYKFISDLS